MTRRSSGNRQRSWFAPLHKHGSTFTLQGFVDSRVPVYIGGALKAWAKPVVCRGVLAVQIESVIHDQGIKS